MLYTVRWVAVCVNACVMDLSLFAAFLPPGFFHFRSPSSPWMVFLMRSRRVVCHWSRREIESNSLTCRWAKGHRDKTYKTIRRFWSFDLLHITGYLFSDETTQHTQFSSFQFLPPALYMYKLTQPVKVMNVSKPDWNIAQYVPYCRWALFPLWLWLNFEISSSALYAYSEALHYSVPVSHKHTVLGDWIGTWDPAFKFL